MKYTIKEIEGIENFLKTYSIFETRDFMRLVENFFREPVVIREGILKDGDEISVELNEYTSHSRQEIKTVTGFKVVQHDSFLLKLVKAI